MTAPSSIANTKAQYEELESDLSRYLESTENTSSLQQDFDALALRVFQFQYLHNRPYQKWCHHRGITAPCTVTRWQDIPAVPTSAFKDSGLQLNCFPPDCLATIFKTSGTTSDQHKRGSHGFHSTKLYKHSIMQAWQQLRLPENLPCLFLTQSSQDAPSSSLSYMMRVLADRSSKISITDQPFFITAQGELDSARLIKICQSLDQPILILGTALAFLHLIESLVTKSMGLPLPDGSALLETGGYKGSGRHLQKNDFYQQLSQTFSLPSSCIHNEYSMTELSSQFYTAGLNQAHRAPHWTRVQVIDPTTRLAVEPGETGHLQFLDLANLGSVAALRTEDLATATTSSQSFKLLGRDPSALPRGCSRSTDEMLD
ncbi:MAG: hypothetical protein L3J39_16325 [Verrucomicrobiales bacterium]|nr:hypothetical protein [Verrucomicrobiales bacterium]